MQGRINIKDDVSYASQEPWLFTDSIKNNILFTEKYDNEKYWQVVESCALLSDFQQLQYGENTLVGERGASLSGGQKARTNLARAVYKEAPIYLFDDPLSAVDANVGRHLYEEVIGPRGILANKTRILITHQVQYLNEADLIVWLENGEITARGNWNTMKTKILESQSLGNIDRILENIPKEPAQQELNHKIDETENANEKDALLNDKANQIGNGHQVILQKSINKTTLINLNL